MITEGQKYYLDSRPDKIVIIKPFDPRVKLTGDELVKELKSMLRNVRVHFGGAAALGLSGQNDIDISILTIPKEYDKHRTIIEKRFGKPSRITKSIRWELQREGFDVELYLTDKNSITIHDQIKVFEILSVNKELRDEYEKIKMPLGEQDYKTYMRKKYEFYNRILGLG